MRGLGREVSLLRPRQCVIASLRSPVKKAECGIGDVEFAARPKFRKMPLVYDFNTSWLSIGTGLRTITAGHQSGTKSAFSFGEACGFAAPPHSISATSLDRLIGHREDGRRNGEAECLGGLGTARTVDRLPAKPCRHRSRSRFPSRNGCPRRTARTFVPSDERQSLVTEAYLARNREFESSPLQQRDAMWGGRRGWQFRRLHQSMECRDASAERFEQVPGGAGPR